MLRGSRQAENSMSSDMRYEFGENWQNFVQKSFNNERAEISKQHLSSFLGRDDLRGLSFLDAGCGSGLHSLAALRAGAERIVSFDLDAASVETTRLLRQFAGNPSNWEICQGSILDGQFLETLERADIVYSWGVLHHTGDMWTALKNTGALVASGGEMYVALYQAGLIKPSDEFWLMVKRRYNEGGPLRRRLMELAYVSAVLRLNPRRWVQFVKKVRDYKKSRGMSYYTDVKDWLGGWPMEFSSPDQVKTFVETNLGMKLVKLKIGQANAEYLFKKFG